MIRLQNDLVPNRTARAFVTVVTVLTVLGLAYFGVVGLVAPGALAPGGDAETAATFASYMSTRNLVMGAAAIVLLVVRAWSALSLVLVLNGVVQALDAVLGLVRLEVLETVAPAVIAVLLFAAVAVLRRQPATAAQPA